MMLFASSTYSLTATVLGDQQVTGASFPDCTCTFPTHQSFETSFLELPLLHVNLLKDTADTPPVSVIKFVLAPYSQYGIPACRQLPVGP